MFLIKNVKKRKELFLKTKDCGDISGENKICGWCPAVQVVKEKNSFIRV